MKIAVATCGTRGDVQPLIALALALNNRGHNTLVAAPPEHAAGVENCGCVFHALGSDFSAMPGGYSQVHTLKPIIGFLGFM
jgi:UDP:flavonoid glycosyltransferase YjiC (YdhE family)